jgi:aminopeptidase N
VTRRQIRPARAAAGAVLVASVLLVGCVPALRQRTGPDPTGASHAATATATAPARAPDGRSTPVTDSVYPQYGNPALDVLSYTLALSWAPARRELAGTATLAIRAVVPVSQVWLAFSAGYTVDSARVTGAPVRPGHSGQRLILPLAHALAADATTTVVVAYHGSPQPVSMPSRRGDFTEGLGLRSAPDGSAWTMQEPFGAFTWYPVNDQPSDEALYDIRVRVPLGWSAISQGRFEGIEAGNTFHWRSDSPVASYLTTLALGRYTEVTDVGPHGIPITYWLRTGKDEPWLPALRRTPELLGWLEDRFGRYPFDSAGVVLVDSTSAMETQQMITLGTGSGATQVDSGRLADLTGTLLHELSHQWFGDAITPADWRDVWLNEGFAMYAQWQWSVGEGDGTDAGWLAWARSRDAASRAVAGPPGHWLPDHFAEVNIYVGPALLLHELHRQLGDTEFYRMCRDWVQSQLNRPVDRAGFTSFVNQHTGHDDTALINQWLDSPTTPPAG